MEAYIFIATFLFFLSFAKLNHKQTKAAMLITVIVLILFDGLRWENGSDWLQYQSYFDRCLYQENERYELGYVYINKFVRSLTSEYNVFLFLHATFLYSILFYLFKRYSVYPLLSFFLFFTLFLGYQGMNRQYLALCFGYIAIIYLLKGSRLLFFSFVAIGSFFHMSVLMLLIALVSRHFLSTRVYVATALVAMVLSLFHIVNNVVSISTFYFFGKESIYERKCKKN